MECFGTLPSNLLRKRFTDKPDPDHYAEKTAGGILGMGLFWKKHQTVTADCHR